MLLAKNTVSTEYVGDKVFEPNQNRSYFFIVFTSGGGSISFGGGGGQIPLAQGEHYNPPVCPTGEINILATGSVYVIHMG